MSSTTMVSSSYMPSVEDSFDKILLLYSGGLDTSCMIKWLQEQYGAEVITLTLDLGQGEIEAAREKAIQLGVREAYVQDARQEFAQNYLAQEIQANGLYQDLYPLATALARPLMSQYAVEIAQEAGADAIAHGCTGKGNDQVRFEVSIAALAPQIKVLAPVRDWQLSREGEVAYAKAHGIPVQAGSPYSIDANLWGRSIECGILEDPAQEPPADIYELVTPPEQAPDQPEYLEIQFEAGLPAALNQTSMGLVELIETLNRLAGGHGVGAIDMTEDRIVGLKSREIYECPAAVTLLSAHRELERFCCTIHENEFKPLVDRKWAELVYKGLWHDPLRDDLGAYIGRVNRKVNGKVRLKLYKGSVSIVGRQSENAIYDYQLATYDEGQTFDQSASAGFIQIWGLPTRVAQQKMLQSLGSAPQAIGS